MARDWRLVFASVGRGQRLFVEDLVLVSARQLVCKIHTVGVLDGLPLSTIFFLIVLGQSVRFPQLS